MKMRLIPLLTVGAMLFGAVRGQAQSDLVIYNDALVNGFEDWSWASLNLNNTFPVYAGSKSMSVAADVFEAISFHHADFDGANYTNFTFMVNGGEGGQRLQVYAQYGSTSGPVYILPSALPTTWQRITIPLTTLGIDNRSNVNRISVQLRNGGTTKTFYVDEMLFTAKPVPAVVNVNVNAAQVLQTANERHFGANLAIWDIYYDPPFDTTTAALLEEMGSTVVRLPGGSLSDEYHWASNKTLSNTWEWATSFSDFVRVITNVGAQAFITVNYGTGTPQEAAGWVRHANITNNLGFKYWEIGNECYGPWETDTNINAHDAYTYAVRASNYIAQMRAADPNIKIGVVSVPGENQYSNGYTNHPAYNARTGQTNYGWTPVMLTTLKNLGVTPDFLVHHHYPQWTDPNNPSASSDNDASLLQSTGNWAADAVTLRQHIVDYFGSGGTNIELVVTENNSDSGAQGRQSTSLVNGLYYADSLGQLLRTEFKGFVWWDFRNGTDTNGFFDPSIYGWQTYGDLGMVNGLQTRHPTFYAAKLMQWFARPGDSILNASSSYGFLSAYAARRANGAIALLVLNKSLTTNLNAQVALNGFTPLASATVRSFGIPNDEAARTNGPAAAKDITTETFGLAGTNFTYNFPRLSMTLLTLAPAAPALSVLPVTTGGEVVLQLKGQPNVRYVLQNSTNLLNWQSVSTNTLSGSTLTLTNSPPFDSDMKFWRAVWEP